MLKRLSIAVLLLILACPSWLVGQSQEQTSPDIGQLLMDKVLQRYKSEDVPRNKAGFTRQEVIEYYDSNWKFKSTRTEIKTIKPGHVVADMVQIPDETEYKDGTAIEAPKVETPTPSGAAKKTALDIKIHEAKAELKKLTKNDEIYYEELGGMGAEHMTELKDLDKDVLLRKLQERIKGLRVER